MILEYPNFITAAEKFFKILMRLRWKVLKDREACGFFMVNPSCKDSLMIHRWCYTPKYLTKSDVICRFEIFEEGTRAIQTETSLRYKNYWH